MEEACGCVHRQGTGDQLAREHVLVKLQLEGFARARLEMV